jgi:hypothetical protein
MRHKVHGRRLGRDTAHRNALRRNLIADLLCFEQITTTEAKARDSPRGREAISGQARAGYGRERPEAVITPGAAAAPPDAYAGWKTAFERRRRPPVARRVAPRMQSGRAASAWSRSAAVGRNADMAVLIVND